MAEISPALYRAGSGESNCHRFDGNNDNYEPRGNDFALTDSLTAAKPVQKFALSV